MDKVEARFFKSQKRKPMVWCWYIDDMVFMWTHSGQKFQRSLQELNKTDPTLKFTHESSKEMFHFWIYLLVYKMETCIKISILKLLIVINISNTTRHVIRNTLRNPLFIVRLYLTLRFVKRKLTLKGTDWQGNVEGQVCFFSEINPKEKQEKGCSFVSYISPQS